MTTCTIVGGASRQDNGLHGNYNTSRTLKKSDWRKACVGRDERNSVLIVLNDQGGGVMSVTNDIVNALRAESHQHEPIILTGDNDGKV